MGCNTCLEWHAFFFCLLSCGSFHVGSSIIQSCTILCFSIFLFLLASAFQFSVCFTACCTIKNPGPQSLLSETSDFFEIGFFTSGLKNGKKYMYVAGRISPSWKCFISAVTYYPIVLKSKIQYNEVWLMLSVFPHAILIWKMLSLGFGYRR